MDFRMKLVKDGLALVDPSQVRALRTRLGELGIAVTWENPSLKGTFLKFDTSAFAAAAEAEEKERQRAAQEAKEAEKAEKAAQAKTEKDK